jgi:hypothetical protein
VNTFEVLSKNTLIVDKVIILIMCIIKVIQIAPNHVFTVSFKFGLVDYDAD